MNLNVTILGYDNMAKISICIPTWEQHGVGLKHLEELKISIDSQIFTDYEIIVSDHSINDDVKNFCKDSNICYFKHDIKRGNSCSNINNSIRCATGEIIKVMFQDDIMYSKNCLEILDKSFTSNVEWVVTASNHTTDGKTFNRDFIPSWNERILSGVNTLGCPSLLSFRNGNGLFFDENLTMLMDVEYYYQLYSKFGHPLIIPNVCVSTRIHKHQISSLYNYNNLEAEHKYIKHKYGY